MTDHELHILRLLCKGVLPFDWQPWMKVGDEFRARFTDFDLEKEPGKDEPPTFDPAMELDFDKIHSIIFECPPTLSARIKDYFPNRSTPPEDTDVSLDDLEDSPIAIAMMLKLYESAPEKFGDLARAVSEFTEDGLPYHSLKFILNESERQAIDILPAALSQRAAVLATFIDEKRSALSEKGYTWNAKEQRLKSSGKGGPLHINEVIFDLYDHIAGKGRVSGNPVWLQKMIVRLFEPFPIDVETTQVKKAIDNELGRRQTGTKPTS